MQQSITASLPVETIGLDLGDRRTSYCHLSAAGLVAKEGELATKANILEHFFEQGTPCRVVVEASGHVHWVAALARRRGHEVIVANPREVRLISQGGRKTDRSDARILAQLGRVDPALLRPVTLRGEGCRASRALLATRDQLVHSRTRLVNLVRGQVKTAGGRIPTCSAESFHKRASAHIPPGLAAACSPSLAVLTALAEQIKACDEQVERACEEQHPETNILRQIPGVGPTLALAYVATLETTARFRSSRSLGNYVGLTPRRDDSGARSPELRISKRGDALLRRLLVNAATYTLGPFGPDSDLRRHGQRLARSGSQRDRARARIAVARKLACLLHHLWRTGSVYQPLREGPTR